MVRVCFGRMYPSFWYKSTKISLNNQIIIGYIAFLRFL